MALEQPFLNGRLARNLHSLAAAAEDRTHAVFSGEGARRIGIGEGVEKGAQAGQVRLPSLPSEPRSAHHQRAAQEDLADAGFLFSCYHTQHLLHQLAHGEFLNHHRGDGDGAGRLGAELHPNGFGQLHK